MRGNNIVDISKVKKTEFEDLTQILDRGIDDMEAGRELTLDDTFYLVADLLERRKMKQ